MRSGCPLYSASFRSRPSIVFAEKSCTFAMGGLYSSRRADRPPPSERKREPRENRLGGRTHDLRLGPYGVDLVGDHTRAHELAPHAGDELTTARGQPAHSRAPVVVEAPAALDE